MQYFHIRFHMAQTLLAWRLQTCFWELKTKSRPEEQHVKRQAWRDKWSLYQHPTMPPLSLYLSTKHPSRFFPDFCGKMTSSLSRGLGYSSHPCVLSSKVRLNCSPQRAQPSLIQHYQVRPAAKWTTQRRHTPQFTLVMLAHGRIPAAHCNP